MENETKNVLLYEEKNRVAIVTLNRPEQHNALSKYLLNSLDLILEKIKNCVHFYQLFVSFLLGHDLSKNLVLFQK